MTIEAPIAETNDLIASPHPLDFDWRFDEPTIAKLCAAVRGRYVLALGAPSIARRIEASGGRVLLVDRQPAQGVDHQLVEMCRRSNCHRAASTL